MTGFSRNHRIAGQAPPNQHRRPMVSMACAPEAWQKVDGASGSGRGETLAFRDGSHDKLVSMTRFHKSTAKARRPRTSKPRSGYWVLQDAKARFSELVRMVRTEGPQHVTVHGRDEVVVIAAEDYRRLKGQLTGKALIAAMQASPHRDVEA